MDSLKLPKANSATSSASGSNSNLSGSTSASASAATSPTSSGTAVGGILSGAPKSPPGLGSSTPISVRFNANEESLDDILQSFHQSKHSPSGGASGGGDASPTSNLLGMKNNGLGLVVGNCDSLSSSPSQPQMQGGSASLFGNDEVSLRNNFMQAGGFFNRKRSGSIEGVSPTSSGPSIISTLSAASAAGGGGSSVGGAVAAGDSSSSGGTWRLIKGKVTQTIEEIKSSKLPPTAAIPIIVADPPSTGWSNDPDSDTECLTVNTSISEELPLDLEHKQNSDSDVEAELLQHDSISLGSGDVPAVAATGHSERSRLRRGLAHIRSKVKAKQQAAPAMNKKDVSPSGSTVPATSVRTGFLRRRNVVEAGSEPSTSQQAEIAIASGKVKKRGILLARKDVEIESGVEVLEDMIPSTAVQIDHSKDVANKRAEEVTDAGADADSRASLTLPVAPGVSTLAFADSYVGKESAVRDTRSRISFFSNLSMLSVSQWREKHQGATAFALPVLLSVLLILLMILPVPDFLRGVFATLLFFTVMDCCGGHLRALFEDFMLTTHPERVAFAIPNYKFMPICEIPAVEEHKTIKTYAGWMNEINSYDPNTFSFSLTRAVYVRLDGSILKMSGTNARIPKRRMWNEPPIDRHKILFTDHRSYDLRDCRIELLPLGLANKRFFNRKYPIQLIIKSNRDMPDEQSSVESQSEPTVKTDAKEAKAASSSGTTPPGGEEEKLVDFAGTVMQADLQQLRNTVNPDKELNDITVPCGDEVRLLLFSRCDREKEDWYRRFTNASKGLVHEQDLQVPMARFVEDSDLQAAAARQALLLVTGMGKAGVKSEDEISAGKGNDETDQQTPDGQFENITEEDLLDTPKDESFDGMIMSANVARNSPDYVRFMAVYQSRRAKRQEDELWKGIDQSLFLGPSGSIVWANVLLGRCLYSWLHDAMLHEKLKEVLQKKLNSIKLPSFMEEVIITNIYLGESPLLCHRVSQPMLDERGVWIDADVTYEGLAHITVTTKLNLLRIRSKTKSPMATDNVPTTSILPEQSQDSRSLSEVNSENVIYDSDAESSGGSSTESESPPPGNAPENAAGTEFFQNSPGNARRIFKIVDRIAASNLFQYATELPYVQRAMENMNANITLRVDLKGLVARGTLNVPPPPSDRVWVSFRGPPRLWISTKPQVGDKSVDWSIVTNVIESKLCEAVNKFLVYPNMVDFSIPFLSNPNYDEEQGNAAN
ncbi:uncharacterized protein LOC6737355 isoform X2 [Drosophila simulans]|uniref:Uncharacterized protein, isoform B n=2 Tax=Drosophila simulans TaxID=7240 RepID=A0A0J9UHL7_DROSI|nr:uncharacterized protein LOC6737355 isoform X2 [Drosophila simulans]KMY98508.1 uncharacterized protein Dsimw501_GD12955, isoform B [Drosophila simulans]KMY98510.1 uncharacterized protein Dsimw501_GD12955, isoform D [Drosophila simulans]